MSAVAASAVETAPGVRMPCLDGLRGLAALMVVFSHAPQFGCPGFIEPLCGAYGVLIFFGLSGFLMGDLYLVRNPTRDAVKGYIAARIARIAPIYYTVVIASFVICTFVWPDFVYRYPFSQLMRLLTFNGSASVFWSTSPEVQFYFVFIPLWLLHARLRNDAVFALIVVGLAATCIVTISWWPGIVVVSKFHIFACGMLAALLRRTIAPQLNASAIAGLHLAGLALIMAILVPGGSEALFGDPHAGHASDPTFAAFYGQPARCLLAGFLAFSFSFNGPIGAVLLANPLGALLERCSFSIYLLHIVIFFVLARLGILAGLPPAAGTLTALALTILVSVATYGLIEAPARARLRRLLLGLMNVNQPGFFLRRRIV